MDEKEKNSILQGTDEKKYIVAKNGMEEFYSKETAESFLHTYEDMSLSFISEHFGEISRELYYGAPFCEALVSQTMISPHTLQTYLEAVEMNIEVGTKNRIPDTQIQEYEKMRDHIKSQLDKMQGTSILDKASNMQYVDQFFDILYDIEAVQDRSAFDEMLSLVEKIDDPYTFFAIAGLLLSKYPDTAPVIYRKTKDFYEPYSNSMDPSKLKTTLQSIEALKILSRDEYIERGLQMSGNINLSDLWHRIMRDNPEEIEAKRTTPIPMTPSVTVGFAEAVMDFVEFEESVKDQVAIARYDNLLHRQEILDHLAERHTLFEEHRMDDVMLEYVLQEMANTEAEIAVLEWEDDGEPNEVIKSHIMTRKQKMEEEIQKEKESDTSDEENKEKNEEDIIITKENKKKREEVLRAITKNTKDGIQAHLDKKDVIKFTEGRENSICLGGFGKEKYKEAFKQIREIVEEFNGFKVVQDNYWTLFLNVKESSEYYVKESAMLPEASSCSFLYETSEEPEKPEEDMPTKIQNRALDRDVKRKEKKARIQEKKVKLKNAAKAETEGIRGEIKAGKNFAEKIDKMDENRRKKFMLKPGYRHRIWRNFKHALMYGSLAKINVFYTPYLMVLRHFSKEKDRRIRNELIRELDTEIKICDEKISDANAKGDSDEKYKLMRIKDKLASEKNRVQINSKYI